MDLWLLIDIARRGEVRIASATPANPTIGKIFSLDTGSMPTFTDALLRFERESGHSLLGHNAVIAIAGPAVGETIPVSRTTWHISRSGVASTLGRPITILNEVAAQAWATVNTPPVADPIRGVGAPDLSIRGRHLFITAEDGLGTAIIDIDEEQRATVLDTEGGHSEFTPHSDIEFALCRALAPLGGPVTFEQVLILQPREPAWRILDKLPIQEREAITANILGRFTANQILSTGSWQGAMLSGKSLPDFHAKTRQAFDAGFSNRKSFPRLIGRARCWQIQQRDPVLAGAVAVMMQRHRTSIN